MGIITLDNINKKEYISTIEPKKQNETIQITWKEEMKMETKQNVITTRDINKTWDIYMNNGWIDGKRYTLGPFRGIKNRWAGKACFIIGSGPDLKIFINQIGFDFFNGRHSIGINHIIESYDGFEWFIFLDRRFLKKTTYNLPDFKGKIFAQNNTGISSKFKNVIRYKCQNTRPTTDITKGLFSNRFSGLAALNLAIIAGANPIFLIGFGMGKDGTQKLFHFRENYQGVGQRPKLQFEKYKKVYKYFERFKKWYPAVIHVTEGESLAEFRKMDFKTFKQKFSIQEKRINIVKQNEPKIIHLSFSNDINRHADITRAIIKNCYGNHFLRTFNNIPKADLYIIEHFMSTNKYVQSFPYKNKTINIVHSMNCIPIGNFLKNVALTNAWMRWLQNKNVNNLVMIPGGIDTRSYENIEYDNSCKIFGRLTRWSPGKIPAWWNQMVLEILNHDKNLQCMMFIEMAGRSRQLLKHDRMIYDYSCKITDFKGNWLKKLGIYIHANGSFRETMSHAIIEAMATGLPIIYLNEIAVKEVVGNAGICVRNKEELKKMILKVMYDENLRKAYSDLSKKRSKVWDIKHTIEGFNKLIKEVI